MNIRKINIIGIIVIIMITIYIWKYYCYPVEINRTLDKEHREIFKNLNKLYNSCEKHWKTEEIMYAQGVQKMPINHKDTTQDWESHNKNHKDLLDKIKEMKNTISQHINEKDKKDFHWAK
jgi:hemerythrin